MAKTNGNHWASGGIPAKIRKRTEKKEPTKVLALELRKQGILKNSEIELIVRAHKDLRKMLAKTNPEWTQERLEFETSQQLKRILKLPKR